MSGILDNFHFLRPWWWLALIALPLLWLGLQRSRAAARSWARVVDPHLLAHVMIGAERSLRAPALLLGLAWLLGVAALAGPAWERLPLPLYDNQVGHLIALELAPSMLAADLKPNRLTRARHKIHGLLDRLSDGQTALLGYAGEAFVVAPLTDDVNTVRNLVDALDPSVMPVSGNATGAAIRRGVALLEQAGLRAGHLLLIADSVSPDAVGEAAAALTKGLHVSVLGVGTAQGAPVSLPQGDFLKDASGSIVVAKLQATALREVAAAGGGSYVELSTDSADLDSLHGLLSQAAVAASATTREATAEAWRDRGPWLALLLLPIAACGFRRGWLMLLPLAVVLAPFSPAQAAGLADLWKRADQQAWQHLQNGDAQQASKLARDPALRGAAAYRAGEFAVAADVLAPLADADSAYNRGNALAQQQQYESAIAAYDEALRRDPQHTDAKANRQAVEDWLKQQKREQKDGQKNPQDKPQSEKQDGQESKNPQSEPGQGEDGKDRQQSDQDQASKNASDEKPAGSDPSAKDGQESQNGAGRDGKSSSADASATEPDSAQSAEQKKDKKEQFEKAMNEAVGRELSDKAAQPEDKAQAAGVASEAEREQDQAIQQWLQRVPDDPGGLLRRKFQLEHERRQRNSSAGGQ